MSPTDSTLPSDRPGVVVSRRNFLKASGSCLALAVAARTTDAATPASSAAKSGARPAGFAAPLAQDYTVITKVVDHVKTFFVNPAFTQLPSGTFVSAVARDPRDREARNRGIGSDIVVSRSDDRGVTWKDAAVLPSKELVGVCLFVHEGKLYLLIAPKNLPNGVIRVAASSDEGRTWNAPVEVLRTSHQWYGGHQFGMVVQNGKLYWAVSEIFQRMTILSCELSRGLQNPAAWRSGNIEEMPIPKEVDAGTFSGPSLRCLEGSVVAVNGRLRVIARAGIDRFGTANLAAIFDVIDNGRNLQLKFVQLYPVPGAQGKFIILHDPVSRYYWMASNLVSHSQYWATDQLERDSSWGTPGNDRRILMLWYSCDALNWFPAGCIAAAQKINQSFHYPCMVFDGADLAVLSRSSIDSNNQHDSDALTFHRVRDFRSLAMDVWPKA